MPAKPKTLKPYPDWDFDINEIHISLKAEYPALHAGDGSTKYCEDWIALFTAPKRVDLTSDEWSEDDPELEPTYIKVGWVQMSVLRLDLMDQSGASAFWNADASEHETVQMVADLFDEEGLRKLVQDQFDGFGDLLVINTVQVNKEFRGYGLGPLLLALAVRSMESGLLGAVLVPGPSEDRGVDRKTAARKIAAMWEEVGFTPLKGYNGMMFLDRAMYDPVRRREILIEQARRRQSRT